MIFYNTDENKETVVDEKTIIQIIAHKDFRKLFRLYLIFEKIILIKYSNVEC